MSKAEKYIIDSTKNYSNEKRITVGKISHWEKQHWLTPDEARKAVEIARKEIYEWLEEHSQEYVYWMDEEFGKDDLINDLKQAMKDK